MKLTEDQRNEIGKYWKEGRFNSYDLMLKNKIKILKEWEMVGIIKRMSSFSYEINRDKFEELDNESVQSKLF